VGRLDVGRVAGATAGHRLTREETVTSDTAAAEWAAQWVSISANVLDVASQTADDTEGRARPFRLGTVDWTRRHHTFHARNAGSCDLLLTYSGRVDPARGLAVHTAAHVLPAGETYDATAHLTTFADGMVVVSRDAPPTVAGGTWDVIRYAVQRMAATGRAVLAKGLHAEIRVTPEGRRFVVEALDVKVVRFTLDLTDQRGRSVKLEAHFPRTAGAYRGASVILPDGLVLDPTIPEVFLTLTYEATSRAALVS
jgi:hypothetical protein